MNRKNRNNKWPQRPSHIMVQEFDNTATFRVSHASSGQGACKQCPQSSSKWTVPLTLQKLQPYLMSIHASLIKNLKQKIIQRQLTSQQDSLIQCSRHNRHLQQFISGILAIETCVNELMKEHMATVLSFTKATNLVLINYKLLAREYMQIKNGVSTSETLEGRDGENSDGFLRFFDSLKFLALVIKNSYEEGIEEDRESGEARESTESKESRQSRENPDSQQPQNTSSSSLRDSWRHQISKLQNLMLYQSILNMNKQQLQNQEHKMLDQKLIQLHNQQSQIIISELQKQNNFLRYQVFNKQNTITQLEESIYNVDLSGYRENEDREDYWARRVKFGQGTDVLDGNNHSNYSQLLNHDGSGIVYPNNRENNVIEEKILQSSQLYNNQELTTHLNILSRKMEELQTENNLLKQQINKYEIQNYEIQHSNYQKHQHTKKSNYLNKNQMLLKKDQKCSQSQKMSKTDKQRLDELIKEIDQMRRITMEMEEQQNSYMEIINDKNLQIKDREEIIEKLKKQVESVNEQLGWKIKQVDGKSIELMMMRKQIQAKDYQISQKNQHLQSRTQQLMNKSQQAISLASQLSTLQQNVSLAQQQIAFLTQSINQMDQQFATEIEKYNEVFCNINQELAQSQERINLLEEDNLKLIERGKKLQEDLVRKDAFIVELQTQVVCGGNPLGNIIERKISKFHLNGNQQIDINNINVNKPFYTRQTKLTRNSSQNPLKQYSHPINNPLDCPSHLITHHNQYHRHISQQSLSPPKRLSNKQDYRSKSPLRETRDRLKKKITIKVEGSKLVNQIVDQKKILRRNVTNPNSQLLTRIKSQGNEKENQRFSPPSSIEKGKRSPFVISPKRQSSQLEVKTGKK